MTIVETPIPREVRGNHRSTAGVHLVARDYPKAMRIDPHMHRESQLIYAAKGTMQVNTPEGRWLVPPDRAVWVPAQLSGPDPKLSPEEPLPIDSGIILPSGEIRNMSMSLSKGWS